MAYDAQAQSPRFSGEGELKNTGGEAAWAAYKDVVRTVYLGKGITTVGEGAFAGFEALLSAELKEGVTTVEAKAFENCAKLATVILPETLTEVKASAFTGCNAIARRICDGTDARWAAVTVGEGNEKLKSAEGVYRKYTITFIVGDAETAVVVKAGQEPVYDGKPAKLGSSDDKVALFTGWQDEKRTSYPVSPKVTPLPKAGANAVYTATFEGETGRFEEGTMPSGRITWALDRLSGILEFRGRGPMDDYKLEALPHAMAGQGRYPRIASQTADKVLVGLCRIPEGNA